MKKTAFILLASSVLLFSSCDKIVSKAFRKTGSEIAETVAEKTAKETAEVVAKKGSRELAEEAVEGFAEKTLKELVSSDALYKNIYEDLCNRVSKEFADDVIVKSTKQGTELVSKMFPSSSIIIKNNTVFAKAGSLVDDGPVNQFLNKLIPNKTYIIDDVFVYKTDKMGRVVSCNADRTKAIEKIGRSRNSQRNTDVQKMIIDELDGKHKIDDGGHLFANNTGGPNELINQVPMNKTINRKGGEWRRLEEIEEKALSEGKQVISQRKLLYKGKERRPYAIEFITKIDGVETKTLVQNP